MITRERAEEIKRKAIELTLCGPWVDKLEEAMTPEEDSEIRAYWRVLPGSASYFDAFADFLSGTVGEGG